MHIGGLFQTFLKFEFKIKTKFDEKSLDVLFLFCFEFVILKYGLYIKCYEKVKNIFILLYITGDKKGNLQK